MFSFLGFAKANSEQACEPTSRGQVPKEPMQFGFTFDKTPVIGPDSSGQYRRKVNFNFENIRNYWRDTNLSAQNKLDKIVADCSQAGNSTELAKTCKEKANSENQYLLRRFIALERNLDLVNENAEKIRKEQTQHLDGMKKIGTYLECSFVGKTNKFINSSDLISFDFLTAPRKIIDGDSRRLKWKVSSVQRPAEDVSFECILPKLESTIFAKKKKNNPKLTEQDFDFDGPILFDLIRHASAKSSCLKIKEASPVTAPKSTQGVVR